MAKAMSIAGMMIGGLVTLVFALDLAIQIPFGRQQLPMDLGFIICGSALAYLSWNAMRDVK